jgi:hypothetical protein
MFWEVVKLTSDLGKRLTYRIAFHEMRPILGGKAESSTTIINLEDGISVHAWELTRG